MRINVYTEEMLLRGRDAAQMVVDGHTPRAVEIVTAEYVSSRTGQPMKNYGLRIYAKSPSQLHHIPGRDDDRSAVTFWCGDSEKNVFAFIDAVRELAYQSTLDTWRAKTEGVQAEADAAIVREAIPDGIYFSPRTNSFHEMKYPHVGMGQYFHAKWLPRCAEFPREPELQEKT